jgi:(R,R)-butanediol dehydrogenase/meso-butanediol dehydrogenase/diacetyl reductase/L-iditol 2-dehydrogenase
MKAACYIEQGILEVMDVEEPQIRHPDDVRIKVDYVSICGSDVEMLYGKVFEKGHTYSILGHEACGTVVTMGHGAKQAGLAVGDRVSGNPYHSCETCHSCQSGHPEMCNHLKDAIGTMCEYVVWRSRNVIKLPLSVSHKHGVLTELVGTCLHAVERACIRHGNTVLIMGAGGGGLILLQLAIMSGASLVAVMEPIARKRMIAESMGATLTVDPRTVEGMSKISKLTGYRGYDCVIDASGDINMVARGFNLLARHGTFLIYSKHGGNSSFNMYEFYIKEATVCTSYMSPFTLHQSIQIMPRLDLNPILSTEYNLIEAQKAFEAHLSGEHPRVLIRISE